MDYILSVNNVIVDDLWMKPSPMHLINKRDHVTYVEKNACLFVIFSFEWKQENALNIKIHKARKSQTEKKRRSLA